MVLALVLALCRSDWRNPLLTRLREQAWPIGCAAVASLVLVAPLLIHSAHTAAQVGTRSYEQVMYLLPGWTSWFQQLPGCLVYGRLYGFFDSHRNPSWWEDSNGLGFATTAIICLGFWAGRRRPLVALLGLVCVASVILTLRLPSGWSLWAGVYYMFPGANGVRAICRIAVFLTLPFGVAAATWIQGRAPRAGLFLAAILVLEQVGTLENLRKSATITSSWTERARRCATRSARLFYSAHPSGKVGLPLSRILWHCGRRLRREYPRSTLGPAPTRRVGHSPTPWYPRRKILRAYDRQSQTGVNCMMAIHGPFAGFTRIWRKARRCVIGRNSRPT